MFSLLYTVLGVCAGAAGMAFIYERRIDWLDSEITWLAAKLYDSRIHVNTWRDHANVLANDLADMRSQLPRRDPQTNRFVKRSVDA